MHNQRVFVNDLMQTNYIYVLSEPIGQSFDTDFQLELNPKVMLELGVFCGKYMTGCTAEFPADWFEDAKLCHGRHDPSLNSLASMPLSLCHIGARRVGFTKTTQEVGFSGIADTTWAEGARTMDAKSRDDGPWPDILPN